MKLWLEMLQTKPDLMSLELVYGVLMNVPSSTFELFTRIVQHMSTNLSSKCILFTKARRKESTMKGYLMSSMLASLLLWWRQQEGQVQRPIDTTSGSPSWLLRRERRTTAKWWTTSEQDWDSVSCGALWHLYVEHGQDSKAMWCSIINWLQLHPYGGGLMHNILWIWVLLFYKRHSILWRDGNRTLSDKL